MPVVGFRHGMRFTAGPDTFSALEGARAGSRSCSVNRLIAEKRGDLGSSIVARCGAQLRSLGRGVHRGVLGV